MRQLAPGATPVIQHELVPRRREMGEAERQLAILLPPAGESRRPAKRPVGSKELPGPNVTDADRERAPDEIRLYGPPAHEKPSGCCGGASGLAGSPGRGSGSLYSPGATSFADSA